MAAMRGQFFLRAAGLMTATRGWLERHNSWLNGASAVAGLVATLFSLAYFLVDEPETPPAVATVASPALFGGALDSAKSFAPSFDLVAYEQQQSRQAALAEALSLVRAEPESVKGPILAALQEGNPGQAADYFGQRGADSERAGAKKDAARYFYREGVFSELSDSQAAASAYARAEALDPNDPDIAIRHGYVLKDSGNFPAAFDAFLRAAESAVAAKANRSVVLAGIGAGQTALAMGKTPEARGAFEKTMQFAGDAGYRDLVAASLSGLAQVALKEGDLGRARGHAKHAVDLRSTLGADGRTARALGDLGTVELTARNYGEAAKHFEKGARLAELSDDAFAAASLRLAHGTAALFDKDLSAAARSLEAAARDFGAIGHKAGAAIALITRAELAVAQGSIADACRFYADALKLSESDTNALAAPSRDLIVASRTRHRCS